MQGKTRPPHVSLIAIPDAVISTLTGIYDVLGAFRMLGRVRAVDPRRATLHDRDRRYAAG